MFSYLSPEERVPATHPLRTVRKMTDEALRNLLPQFAAMYSRIGRPFIAPERFLRTLLVQAFFSVRSERQLMEQLNYNLLFRRHSLRLLQSLRRTRILVLTQFFSIV
jgi:transposase